MRERKLAKKFNRQARMYEKQRKNQTLKKWRQQLIRHAHGNVLELAVGAGANFPYYQKDVQVTGIDISPKMIEKAKEGASFYHIDANFLVGNVEKATFENEQFDTVVSTLSFCGYDDPLQMLALANQWCKPGGTILLMEHGISRNRLLSLLQNMINPVAKWIVGCHQNRPIMNLIEQSPLKIIHHETHVQGILQIVRAKATST